MVFCPRAGPSLQAQEPSLQICRRQVFHLKPHEPRLQFYQGLNRCGSFPLLSAPHSIFSILTNLKKSEKTPWASTWRWGEWIWQNGPSGLRWKSPQGLNISSIRVFDQIRDPEIPITLRPHQPLYHLCDGTATSELPRQTSPVWRFYDNEIINRKLDFWDWRIILFIHTVKSNII